MKFLLIAFLAFFIVCVSALAPRKQVVITYDSATPDSVIQAAMQAIKDAGGLITHEYSLIRGFAAKASQSTLETMSALSAQFKPTIEEDVIVTTFESGQ